MDLYLNGFLGCPALFLQAELQLLVVPVQLTQLLPGLGRFPLSLFAQSLDRYTGRPSWSSTQTDRSKIHECVSARVKRVADERSMNEYRGRGNTKLLVYEYRDRGNGVQTAD